MVARSWKWAWEVTANGNRVSFRGDENVLESAIWFNNFVNILKTNGNFTC